MNDVIAINDVNVQICEYKEQRVVTFQQIADVHRVSIKSLQMNYRNNAKHFIEGEDTYLVDFSENQKLLGFEIPPRGLRVFTETGYLMLVKTLKDDRSWDMQRKLVRGYFRGKELEQIVQQSDNQLALLTQQVAELASSVTKLANVVAQQQAAYAQQKLQPVKQLPQQNTYNVQQFASRVGMTRSEVFSFLKENGFTYSSQRCNNMPQQWLLDQLMFVMRPSQNYDTPILTSKGAKWLRAQLKKAGRIF